MSWHHVLRAVQAFVVTVFVAVAASATATAGPPAMRGDLNCDGVISVEDIEPFAFAVLYPSDWCELYERTMAELLERGDFDGDGRVAQADTPEFCGELYRADAHGRSADARAGAGQRGSGAGAREGSSTPRIDLDVDSDNDNGTAFPERDGDPNVPNSGEEWLESSNSKYVLVNDDDDDGNFEPDVRHDGAISDESGELVPVLVAVSGIDPNYSDAVFEIKASDITYLRMWRRPTRGRSDPNHPQDRYLTNTKYDIHAHRVGDCDCDRDIDYFDIDPFILALSNPSAYDANYPNCSRYNADADMDGDIDFFDIDPFIALVGQSADEALYLVRIWVEATTKDFAPTGTDVQAWLLGPAPEFTPLNTDEVMLHAGAECDGTLDLGPEVPQGYDCGATDWLSTCYGGSPISQDHKLGEEARHPNQTPLHRAGGLNIDLWCPLASPSFPPLTRDQRRSSSPIVSAESAHPGSRGPMGVRPMLNGILDLVLGIPLLQETDLELPFGGATFRHIRTYGWPVGAFEVISGLASNRFWDWNGRQWMMSEAPLFLIDFSKVYVRSDAEDVPRCYFIPDAHHVIPFIWKPSLGRYEAPGYFDAALTYTDDDPNDSIPPQMFFVHLANGAITYTIEPHYEDLEAKYVDDPNSWDPNDVFHVHSMPPLDDNQAKQLGGNYQTRGIPYYGLVTKIEDRLGNAVLYDYCTARQTTQDNQSTEHCVECAQNCRERGQIRSIRLVSADDVAVWTLLYTYRTFKYDPNIGHAPPVLHAYQNALHSIHVYPGYATRGGETCPTLPADAFCATTLETMDAVDANVPPGWTKCIRYLYSQPGHTNAVCPGIPERLPELFQKSFVGTDDDRPVPDGVLVKVTAIDAASGEDAEPRVTLYRYGNMYVSSTEIVPSDGARVRAVYYDSTIRTILSALSADDPNGIYTACSLIAMPDNHVITGIANDPNLIACADLYMEVDAGQDEPNLTRPERTALVGHDPLKTSITPSASLHSFVDRRAGASDAHLFTVYNYWLRPEVWQGPGPAYWPTYPAGCELQHPFQDRQNHSTSALGRLVQLAMDRPNHVTIVEELGGSNGPLLRRWVTKCNPAGLVLSQRVIGYEEDPDNPVVQSEGYAEERIYDEHLRMSEFRSAGWGSLNDPNVEGLTQGLIRVFEYPTIGTPNAHAPIAVGIKQGKNGATKWIERYERDPNIRPDLTRKVTRFPTPVDNWQTGDGDTVETIYTLDAARNNAITAKLVITGDAEPLAGAGSYYAIQREQYDVNGNLIYQGAGSVQNPTAAPTASDEFAFVQQSYDPNNASRLQQRILDPAGGGLFQHQPPDIPALNDITAYTYEEPWGLSTVVEPSGREQWIKYWIDPNAGGREVEQWTFKDVTNDNGQLKVGSPITVNRFNGSQLKWSRTGTLDPNTIISYPPAAPLTLVTLSQTDPNYGANGQVTGVSTTGGGATLSASISYDGFGNVAREKSPDGTVSRYTYDERGRLQRTFRGTRDTDGFWTDDPNQQAPDPNDNLVLVEKRYYGAGVTDAGQLITVREYLDETTNQYEWWDPNGLDPNGNPCCWYGGLKPDADTRGRPTAYDYDWRMRPVSVTQYSEAGLELKRRLTWYDNLDRERYAIELEPDTAVPANVDPLLAVPGQAEPASGSAFAALAPPPISVTETLYNSRGQPKEVRNWFYGDPNGPWYTATTTSYDHAGRPREVRSPNSPVMRYRYDAKGRQIVSQTVAACGPGPADDVAVAETLSTYDDFDHVIRSQTRERGEDGVYISTFVFNWYDDAGRINATANYGTNRTDDTWSAGGTDPGLPTLQSAIAAGALVTQYGYDAAGRQNLVIRPDGTHTATLYDDLGRVRLVTEDATDRDNDGIIVRTAYQYDPNTGQLTAIAAVPATYANITDVAGVNEFFSSAPPPAGAQITTLAYDALVYPAEPNAAWTAQSAHKGWVSQVTYPDGTFLNFDYYADGKVARRTDARGVILDYDYDDLGRIADVWINDNAYFAYQSWQAARMGSIHNDYDSKGRLWKVTTDPTGGTKTDVTLTYDMRGNLLVDSQKHSPGHAAVDVSYTWSCSPQSAYNYDRLSKITYPLRNGKALTLQLSYGSGPTTIDGSLSQVTKIRDVGYTSAGTFGEFWYCGQRRRIGSWRALGSLSQDFGADSSFPGLDRFGRTKTLSYSDGSEALYCQ